MPSQGRRAEQIDIYVPQEEACGREKPGNGVEKPRKGRIPAQQEKIRRKEDYGLPALKRQRHKPQDRPQDHEEVRTQVLDGEKEQEIQFLQGYGRKDCRQQA